MLIILSAPSGCGKSTIAEKLVSFDHNIVLSISNTTRAPRIGEIDGIHYFFKTPEEFEREQYLESATIYDHRYGTPLSFVQHHLQLGKDVLFDIDYQGTKQILAHKISKIVSIFILPPSIETLRHRLESRGDKPELIKQRLALAQTEIDHAKYYDYVVVNDNLDTALHEIQSIILKERTK